MGASFLDFFFWDSIPTVLFIALHSCSSRVCRHTVDVRSVVDSPWWLYCSGSIVSIESMLHLSLLLSLLSYIHRATYSNIAIQFSRCRTVCSPNLMYCNLSFPTMASVFSYLFTVFEVALHEQCKMWTT